MDNVNYIQIGGNHYRKMAYQHWDLICDIPMHPLTAATTKYVSRWRDKNGVEDLEKAIHYLMKMVSREIHPETLMFYQWSYVDKFCKQLCNVDSKVVKLVLNNEIDSAITEIKNMIALAQTTLKAKPQLDINAEHEYLTEPSSSYTNQG